MRCLVDRDDCDYDMPQFGKTEIRTSRKVHRCGECRKTIHPGQKYEYITFYDNGFGEHKTCPVCLELRERFCCGWVTGEIRWDIEEALREKSDLDLGCLDGLSKEAFDFIANTLERIWDEAP